MYACEFKGHTATRVTPLGIADRDSPPRYRMFRREAMSGDHAPLKAVPEYVHPAELVQWQVS
jgi:hypothetical protein